MSRPTNGNELQPKKHVIATKHKLEGISFAAIPYVGLDTRECFRKGNKWFFECDNGISVKCEFRCDYRPQCVDLSDEKDCNECVVDGYTCDNSTTCISYYRLCDGKKNCEQEDDEMPEI